VLRYDDRGVAESTGDYESATTADLATDASAALDYLLTREEINPAQIGLLGHSEGGAIAPMIAAERADVAFVIALAGSSVSGYDTLIKQNERLLAANGLTDEEIASRVSWVTTFMDAIIAEDWESVETLLRADYQAEIMRLPEEQQDALGDTYIDEAIAAQMPGLQVWMRYFLLYDPAVDWANVTVPVLAFFGGLDVQVDAEQNAPVLERVLAEAGNTDVTIIVYDNANHLFQAAVTGSVNEYGALEQTFVPELLPAITDWLLARVDVAG
jgi:pimeloyl-ACP methyl ester carboxylesterase